MPKLEAVYLDYTGVAEVAVGAAPELNYSVSGLDVNVFNTTSAAELYTLTGVCVARGQGCVTAPCAGIYVLRTEGGAAKLILSE